MVVHARKLVRDAAVADLTGLATSGTNVFTGRVAPLTADELPGIVVMIRDESSDWDVIGTIDRTPRLLVVATAQGGDELEDTLDTMAAEIEAALYGSGGTLDALLQMMGPPTTQIDIPEPPEGQLRRTGKLWIMVPVTYRTATGAPTAIV